jgi:hypothetical protein
VGALQQQQQQQQQQDTEVIATAVTTVMSGATQMPCHVQLARHCCHSGSKQQLKY